MSTIVAPRHRSLERPRLLARVTRPQHRVPPRKGFWYARSTHTAIVTLLALGVGVPVLHGALGLTASMLVVTFFGATIFSVRGATPAGLLAGLAGAVAVLASPEAVLAVLLLALIAGAGTVTSPWWLMLEREAQLTSSARTAVGRAWSAMLVVAMPSAMAFLSLLFVNWTLARSGF